MTAMRFLITNDDGFDAPGLIALYEALCPLGEVTVVAPSVCHSSKGHAVDTKKPIRVERRRIEPFGDISIVHSSPADCIRVGMCHLLTEPPDVVVAGINPGANLGVDLFYSGTAAAAREAALLGVPAIALSRYLRGDLPFDWKALSRHTTRVVAKMLTAEFCLPRGHFWNVNFPAMDDDRYPEEITIADQGTEPHAVAFQVLESGADSQLLAYSAQYRDRGKSGSCDVSQLFEHRLTATPVGPQLTSAVHVRELSGVSLLNLSCPH